MTSTDSEKEKPSRHLIKILIFVGMIAVLTAVSIIFDFQQPIARALGWISTSGYPGMAVFVLVFAMACVLFVPGTILTIGAGVIFGIFKAVVLVSIGSTIGAGCAFLIGRYLARNWVAEKIAGNEKFIAIDQGVAMWGWKIVLLSRMSPIFPFNLLNYAYGLTAIKFRHYLLASWIGMIPGSVIFIYIGSVAGSLAAATSKERTKSTTEWLLYGLGLIATIVIAIVMTWIAKKILFQKISTEENRVRQAD